MTAGEEKTISPVYKIPQLISGFCVKAVKVVVLAAKKILSLYMAGEGHVAISRKGPHRAPGFGIKAVHLVINTAHVYIAIQDRRRGVHIIGSLKFPCLAAILSIEAIDLVIVAADIYIAVREAVEDCTASPVLNSQTLLPFCASRQYTLLSLLPTYTPPADTNGHENTALPVANSQTLLPSCSLKQ